MERHPSWCCFFFLSFFLLSAAARYLHGSWLTYRLVWLRLPISLRSLPSVFSFFMSSFRCLCVYKQCHFCRILHHQPSSKKKKKKRRNSFVYRALQALIVHSQFLGQLMNQEICLGIIAWRRISSLLGAELFLVKIHHRSCFYNTKSYLGNLVDLNC